MLNLIKTKEQFTFFECEVIKEDCFTIANTTIYLSGQILHGTAKVIET